MIIITAVGSDRPGMAHAVAAILADTGCNIEDTTMTRLCGEFAMILIVAPPPELSAGDLAQSLAPLEKSHGLFVNCRDIPDEETAQPSDAPRYILSAYGPDKSGLLAALTAVLAENGVNITDVQTRVASAGQTYIMILEIELPSNLRLDLLETALAGVAQRIGVQITLHALEEDYM